MSSDFLFFLKEKKINMSTSKNNHKKNGFTEGRQSLEKKNERQAIGLGIIREHDFKLTKRQFHKLYYEAIISDPDTANITIQTVYSDRIAIEKEIRKDNPGFKFESNPHISNTRLLEENKNIPISYDIVKRIQDIRLEINGHSYSLYNKKTNLFKKGRIAFVDNQIKEITSINTTCDDSYMIHLYLIFDVKRYQGVEDYMCSFYKEKLNYILYTSSHNYCAEIVTEYCNLELLITDTWKIFKKHFK